MLLKKKVKQKAVFKNRINKDTIVFEPTINADREEIISNIKLLAKGANGIPPGVRKFQSHTGIKKYQWLGKYWVKWSDALAEAGFSNNSMIKAYDDKFLLKCLADYIVELKKYPTEAELRFKRHNDKNFPDFRRFKKHFVSLEGILYNLLNYCENKPGYETVIEVCREPYFKLVIPPKPLHEIKFENNWFINVINCGGKFSFESTDTWFTDEYYKKKNYPAEINWRLVTDDPQGIIDYWHRRFASKTEDGIWFNLTHEDVLAIHKRTYQ